MGLTKRRSGAIEGEHGRDAAAAAGRQRPPGQQHQQAGGHEHDQSADQRRGL
ncbi:hypothetical protein [Synechococcus sp. CBW1004]|uniref:hypothetical protein n=1 Tax=Synechococcus sp. CBW1004 TaxID=1353136 RepID=UPI001E5649E8|nr:hypothetical protein [Synechococcus sp. CBW1004]